MVKPSPMSNGFCVALTGGIACGKTAVAALWRQWGADVLDADEVAHALIAPGGECVQPVLDTFGPAVRAGDGGIHRDALGQIVFAQPEERRRLEAILHPVVIRRMRAWADTVCREGRQGVAVIPLLFEAGLENEWDAVICVVADEPTMLKRLALRGWTPAEARARIASQWPVRDKAARAHHVIENNGSLAELESASRAIWNHLAERGEHT